MATAWVADSTSLSHATSASHLAPQSSHTRSAKLGVITGWGGTQRLPRILGRTHALEMFVTARRISSAEALKAGLITQIADPVLDAAMVLASQIISTS